MVFRTLLFKSIELKFFLVYDLTPKVREMDLMGLNALIEAGKIKHCVARTFKLEELVLAHEAVESGLCVGNVVIEIH